MYRSHPSLFYFFLFPGVAAYIFLYIAVPCLRDVCDGPSPAWTRSESSPSVVGGWGRRRAMCVWSLSGPLFHGGSGGGRTLCVLSFVLLDNRPLTPRIAPIHVAIPMAWAEKGRVPQVDGQ